MIATAILTRAEAAYAHLASFQRGDTVDVAGDRFFMPGIVTQPQQDGPTIEDAYLVVSGTPATNGARQKVYVRDLLHAARTITTWADAATGNVRYFDQAGYAAQNPEG